MSAEIIGIHGVEPPLQGRPNEKLVERLEILLDRARCGEIVGAAWVTANEAGCHGAGYVYGPDIVSQNAIMAGLSVLKHQLLTSALEAMRKSDP